MSFRPVDGATCHLGQCLLLPFQPLVGHGLCVLCLATICTEYCCWAFNLNTLTIIYLADIEEVLLEIVIESLNSIGRKILG